MADVVQVQAKKESFCSPLLSQVHYRVKPPYITLIVFMRGILHHTYTRIYFPDEVELNEKDEVLNTIPAWRRTTLIAAKTENRI